MSNTLTLIQKITVGATVSSGVTFNNIPQGYSDLKVFGSVRSNVGNPGDFIYLYLNNPGTGAYTQRFLRADGSSASSGNNSVSYYPLQFINGGGSTANTFGNFEIYIPNYTSSNQKSFSVDIVSENNSTTAYADIQAGLWNQTAAVTGITLNSGSGNFVQHSTFYLYGVTKFGVSTPSTAAAYATGGDIITTDGTYWYHAFRSSGTFTPRKSLSCDVLVVAGGGGATNGNAEASGGGGAGGLAYQEGRTLNLSTTYAITVGAGGTGSSISSGMPTQGSNSVFDTITANGGGASRSESLSPTTLKNGGSGGGGGGNGGGVGAGTATQGNSGGATGFGNNGGTGFSSNPYTGGGGGGAGAVGANATSTGGGNGGAGKNDYSTWASATGTGVNGYYAGGGGGGNYSSGGVGTATTGGAGGGGNGGKTTSTTVNNQPTAGTANTGGGAGGGQGSSEFKNGGSGIVIVRYPV